MFVCKDLRHISMQSMETYRNEPIMVVIIAELFPQNSSRNHSHTIAGRFLITIAIICGPSKKQRIDHLVDILLYLTISPY